MTDNRISQYSANFTFPSSLKCEEDEQWAIIHNYKNIADNRFLISTHARCYDMVKEKLLNITVKRIYHMVYVIHKDGNAKGDLLHTLVYKFLSGDEEFEKDKDNKICHLLTDVNHPEYDYLKNLSYGNKSKNYHLRKENNEELVNNKTNTSNDLRQRNIMNNEMIKIKQNQYLNELIKQKQDNIQNIQQTIERMNECIKEMINYVNNDNEINESLFEDKTINYQNNGMLSEILNNSKNIIKKFNDTINDIKNTSSKLTNNNKSFSEFIENNNISSIDLSTFVSIGSINKNGFEANLSHYLINKNGDIYNTNTKKMIYGRIHNDGYRVYHLTGDFSEYNIRAHRLLGKIFLPDGDKYFYDENYQVNHKDKNPLNNNIDNLEWMNIQEHSEKDHGVECYKLDLSGKIIQTFKSKKAATRDSGQKTLDLHKRKAKVNEMFGIDKDIGIIKKENCYYATVPRKYVEDDYIDVANLYVNKARTKICRADDKGYVDKVYDCYDDIMKEFGYSSFQITENLSTSKELYDQKIMVKDGYLWKCRKMEKGKDIWRNLFNE